MDITYSLPYLLVAVGGTEDSLEGLMISGEV